MLRCAETDSLPLESLHADRKLPSRFTRDFEMRAQEERLFKFRFLPIHRKEFELAQEQGQQDLGNPPQVGFVQIMSVYASD